MIGAVSTFMSTYNFLSLDYRRLAEVLNFEIGGNTTQCYTIDIITDIAYEGTKEFRVVILSIRNERIELFPNASVVILDYNGK